MNDQGIDLIILADCVLSNPEILAALNRRGSAFATLAIPHPQVKFFRRLTAPDLVPVLSDERFQFVGMIANGFEEILIRATHLDDRRNFSLPESRHAKVSTHIKTLFEAETFVNHNRTTLIGDFNMTPEEPGMVNSVNSFGALMSWDLARAQSDPELQEPPRFFNPMWSLMGRAEAPGTDYWNATDSHKIDWYCSGESSATKPWRS